MHIIEYYFRKAVFKEVIISKITSMSKEKLASENREDQFTLNKLLIDFTNIPEELRNTFTETYRELFTL